VHVSERLGVTSETPAPFIDAHDVTVSVRLLEVTCNGNSLEFSESLESKRGVGNGFLMLRLCYYPSLEYNT
jgi:hypothetical protein